MFRFPRPSGVLRVHQRELRGASETLLKVVVPDRANPLIVEASGGQRMAKRLGENVLREHRLQGLSGT